MGLPDRATVLEDRELGASETLANLLELLGNLAAESMELAAPWYGLSLRGPARSCTPRMLFGPTVLWASGPRHRLQSQEPRAPERR